MGGNIHKVIADLNQNKNNYILSHSNVIKRIIELLRMIMLNRNAKLN